MDFVDRPPAGLFRLADPLTGTERHLVAEDMLGDNEVGILLVSANSVKTQMCPPLQFGLCTFGDSNPSSDYQGLDDAEVLRNVFAEAMLADRVGVDHFGVGEHHRNDFVISSPEVLLAAIAVKTERVRVGTAASILSTDDPVRLYQRFSTLNAITPGRVEIIVGRGWYTESFALFGRQLSDSDALFEQNVQLLALLNNQPVVTWRGTSRPPLNKQQVHPVRQGNPIPIWVAVGPTPNSALIAARFGLPMMLAIIGGPPQRFSPFVELHRLGMERLGLSKALLGVHSAGYIADSDERAQREYWDHYSQFRNRLGEERGWPPFTRAIFDREIAEGSLYVGSPDTVADKIFKLTKALPITRFDLKYSMGGLDHTKMMRSIELYGSKVIPRVEYLLSPNCMNS